jgi:NitT/TauT family transport system permease protein
VTFLSKARFFGLTGFTVLFTLLFGGGQGLKVGLLVFGMSVFYLTSMASIVDSTPRDELDYARTLRFGDWRVVWEVIILGRFDQALEALRQNAAMGWVMLTMVEGVTRAQGGVGVLMLNENKHFKLASVFAIQITIFIVGILQDQLLGYLRKIVCPYADLTLERK